MSTIFYGGGACGLRVCASAHALTSAYAPDGGAIGTSRNAAPAQYWCVVAHTVSFTEDPNNVLFSVKA